MDLLHATNKPALRKVALRGGTLADFYRSLMVIHDWICGEDS